MNQNRTFIGQIESTTRRDLYFSALYRALEAGLLAGMVFSPVTGIFGDLDSSPAAKLIGVAYLLAAVVLLLLSKQWQWMRLLVTLGLLADISAASAITWLMPETGSGIGMLLLFNVAIAAVLLPFRLGMALAAVAVTALLGAFVLNLVGARGAGRPLTELMMIPVTYIAVAYLAGRVGHRARQNQQLAAERGAEVASLVEVNELIIRRMRTGVLVVDGQFQIRLANEAAAALLGSEGSQQHDSHLMDIAPQLAQRLDLWRHGFHNSDETPLQLQPGQPEVQPRFARLLAGSDLSLVFLDDASVVSRRAESLTLATLGRFSASLAHEIRNPLTAINYAVQLLQESEHLDETDLRLLSIIHLQCQRTNGIVENVLSLARRERANPEHLELGPFIQQFADEYRMTMPLETDQLETLPSSQEVIALVDPAHLHQIISVLVQNAFKYGRRPNEPARVRLRIANEGRNALLDVSDHGPGIPPAIVEKLFEAFYTTSEHGTGLGLYIARELCRANQATLEYLPSDEGGSCFRITLPGPHALLADNDEMQSPNKISPNGNTTGRP